MYRLATVHSFCTASQTDRQTDRQTTVWCQLCTACSWNWSCFGAI